jgi:DNA ligase 1
LQLEELVQTSAGVAGTRSRTRKVTLLTDVLAALAPEERHVGVAFLSGEPRQDRLDLGPAAVHGTTAEPVGNAELSLLQVDAALQGIADVASGTGSRTARIGLLTELLGRATATEQDWLRRLVLRELRQGALEGVLVPAIAAAARVDQAAVRRAAMLTGDLRITATLAFEGGMAALNAVQLQVGTPLQPMLATTATDVTAALGDGGETVVEAKLDGARVQVHRDGDDIRVFTRALHDITPRVPEVVELVAALPVDAIVLDGEAIAFDADDRPLPFQETMQRFGRANDVADARDRVPLEVRFFDILHLDGVDLLDRSLRARREALARILPADARVRSLVTGEERAVRDFIAEVLRAGHEGVMVKDLDGPYEAGRRGAGWRKLKPVHTLDLVVLAAEWGSGRRRGWLSNLHLGARADDGDGFVMLGKTFKGLTDDTLAWQTDELLARETHRDGHVVHVVPELVVEIAIDGLVRSTRYPGGLALRFARVRHYRPDKNPVDADTLHTVRAIHRGAQLPRID